MGYTEAFADAFKGINIKASLDDNPIYDNPMMDEDPGPDKPGLLPPPPNPAAIGVPPPPQIGDIKQSGDGGLMVYTGLPGWKYVPSPNKIMKGVTVTTSSGPVHVTSFYPGWANNSLVSPSFFSKPDSPPLKKPDLEPMDLSGKRRICLNE